MIKDIIRDIPDFFGLVRDYITSTDQTRQLLRLVIAAVLLLFGLCILNPIVTLIVNIVALLIVIYDVVLFAIADIRGGNFFSVPLCLAVGCIGAAIFGFAAAAAAAAILYHCGLIATEIARFRAGDELRLANSDRPDSVTVMQEGTAREMRTAEVREGYVAVVPADSYCAFDGVVIEGDSAVYQPEPAVRADCRRKDPINAFHRQGPVIHGLPA